MAIDKESTLSDNQDLTGQGVGSVYSDKFYVLPPTGIVPLTGVALTRDAGRGRGVDMFVRCTKAFASQNSTATVQFSLVIADDENGTNAVTLAQTPAILVTALLAGYEPRLAAKLPHGMTKAAFAIQYTVAVEALTAGKVHASVGLHGDDAYTG